MMRILNMIVFPLTIISGVLLSAAGLAPFVHPKHLVWLQFLGLTFPALFFVNILWLIYWWAQLRMKMIFPLCVLVLNLIHVSKFVQFTRNKTNTGNSIKLATYNAQLFGALTDSGSLGSIISAISNEKADIFCLQEVYSKNKVLEKVKTIKDAGNFSKFTFYRLNPKRPYGMAIYSKFNIVATGKINIGDSTGNMVIFADLIIGTDTVRVYNVHLQSFRFLKSEYSFVQQAESEEFFNIKTSKNIVFRMKEAYQKRADQADKLHEHIKSCRYKAIIMGDFNDVPLSYTYNKVGKDFIDAFRECGNGFEKTYKGPFPNFRIDYILFSKQFKCLSYNSISKVPGDHKMVSAQLQWKGIAN